MNETNPGVACKACTRRRVVARLVGVVSLLALPAWFAQPALASHQPTHNEWFGFYRVEIGKPPGLRPGRAVLPGTRAWIRCSATFFVPQDGYVSLSANLAVERTRARGIAMRACSAVSRAPTRFPSAWQWRRHPRRSRARRSGCDVTGGIRPARPPGYSIKHSGNSTSVSSGDAPRTTTTRTTARPPGCPHFHQPPRQRGQTTGKAERGFRFRGGRARGHRAKPESGAIYAGSTTPVQLECQPAQGLTVTLQTARGPVSAQGIATWDFIRNSASNGEAELQKASQLYRPRRGLRRPDPGLLFTGLEPDLRGQPQHSSSMRADGEVLRRPRLEPEPGRTTSSTDS